MKAKILKNALQDIDDNTDIVAVVYPYDGSVKLWVKNGSELEIEFNESLSDNGEDDVYE